MWDFYPTPFALLERTLEIVLISTSKYEFEEIKIICYNIEYDLSWKIKNKLMNIENENVKFEVKRGKHAA